MRRSGFHEGGIADTSTSEATRSGWRAANAAAINPPYETPQIAARVDAGCIHRLAHLLHVAVESRRRLEVRAASTLVGEREREDAATARERVDARLHPLPAPLDAGNDDDGRAGADVDDSHAWSVSQRLARLERVLDPLQRLPLAEQAEERLTLEIEQLLLADGRWMRQRRRRP